MEGQCLEQAAPLLLADAMLGRLARWLRVIGYDTLYLRGDDAEIAYRARAEGRVLLTRDRELARRRGLDVILVVAQTLAEQVSQVVAVVGPPPMGGPRCMVCNGALVQISHNEAAARVPAYVAQTQHTFHRCTECDRIYWQGTHWDGIQGRIGGVMEGVLGSRFG